MAYIFLCLHFKPISSVQLHLTLCNPMDFSPPDFLVHYQFSEFAQTHVHPVGDAIQPSLPLSPTSPPAFNLSQHQGLLKDPESSQFLATGDQSIGASISPSVMSMNILQGWFPLGWTDLMSLQSKWLSRVFSNTTVQKHKLFYIQLSL